MLKAELENHKKHVRDTYRRKIEAWNRLQYVHEHAHRNHYEMKADSFDRAVLSLVRCFQLAKSRRQEGLLK